ncbi:MAG: hypothetical protein E6G47_02430 [Actinobacteria bacterium]|nr:MAG: hypothetical protein E6G47_02430 [Actinomycetota bacterium]
MRLTRFAFATITVVFGLLFAAAAVLGLFDYLTCRGDLAEFNGSERDIFTLACNYDMRVTIEGAALALALGVVTYFLLRSRWRKASGPERNETAPVAPAAN